MNPWEIIGFSNLQVLTYQRLDDLQKAFENDEFEKAFNIYEAQKWTVREYGDLFDALYSEDNRDFGSLRSALKFLHEAEATLNLMRHLITDYLD